MTYLPCFGQQMFHSPLHKKLVLLEDVVLDAGAQLPEHHGAAQDVINSFC